MIFATENKPKGPAISELEPNAIDLSGTKLHLSIPYGNRSDIPEPAGKLIDKCNIYELTGNSLSTDNDNKALILQRPYKYTGFLGQNIGSLTFSIHLLCCKNANTNLFDAENLKRFLAGSYKLLLDKWNKEADEFAQILAPDKYTTSLLNNLDFVHYTVANAEDMFTWFSYATSITEDCCLEFVFDCASTIDKSAAWYKMAKDLEALIMNSVRIELTESAKLAKASWR
jgi:hypothetical protein